MCCVVGVGGVVVDGVVVGGAVVAGGVVVFDIFACSSYFLLDGL